MHLSNQVYCRYDVFLSNILLELIEGKSGYNPLTPENWKSLEEMVEQAKQDSLHEEINSQSQFSGRNQN